jgi:uncharacterized caspase-like protein
MYECNSFRMRGCTLFILCFTLLLSLSFGCTKEELKSYGKEIGDAFVDSLANSIREGGDSSSSGQETSTSSGDTDKPAIVITSHDTSRGIEIVSKDDSIRIEGKIADDSELAGLFINGEKSSFDGEGNFSHEVNLSAGLNTVKIVAVDTYGNEARKEILINNQSDSLPVTNGEPSYLASDENLSTLPVWYRKQYGLVIGINKYENPQIPTLRNAVNDAKEVSSMLNGMGFEVFEMYNAQASRDSIIQRLKYIRQVSDVNDSFLLYFAGHGQGLKLQSGKEVGYVIPYDAKIDLTSKSVIDFDESAIALEYIKKILEDMKPKHISLLLDSCFSGLAMKRSIPDTSNLDFDYYKDILNRRAINILTAGDDQPVSDGTGHSPFTKAILQGLRDKGADIHDRDGYVTFGQIAVYVKDKVGKATNRRQRPQFDNFIDDDGEFIFKVR